MKRYIKSTSDGYRGYNISWASQDGRQWGEYVEVPDGEQPGAYIERYMYDKYGDDVAEIADYVDAGDYDDESGDPWDDYAPIQSSEMTEEDMLDQAILDGRPFDLATFEKYKVDPYRAEGAVRASELKVGDIIQVTEDASEIDCPSPEIEIFKIYTNDPDGYDDYGSKSVLTFDCCDNETGDEYRLHFWPTEYVGPIISRKSDYAIKSATDVDDDDWDWTPYHGHNYRVDGGQYSEVINYFDNPVDAIAEWFELEERFPMDVAILCPTKALAIELVKAATSELLTELYATYPDCPYKLDYLINESQKALSNSCRGFYENEYGYGDTVHPFGVG